MARGQRAGNPTPRCQARVLAGSPDPSAPAPGQRRQRQGDLTWAGRGSSADEGVTWTALRRGVCSSTCPSSTESSSWSPCDGGLSPSMDGRGGPGSPRGASGTHWRVQSPEPPRAGGAAAREQSGGRLFFWFVRGAACTAYTVFPCWCRYEARRPGWRAGRAQMAGSAVPRKKVGIPPAET